MTPDILVDFFVASTSWQIFFLSLWQARVFLNIPEMAYVIVNLLKSVSRYGNFHSEHFKYKEGPCPIPTPSLWVSEESIINCVWHCGGKIRGLHLSSNHTLVYASLSETSPEKEWNLRLYFLSIFRISASSFHFLIPLA